MALGRLLEALGLLSLHEVPSQVHLRSQGVMSSAVKGDVVDRGGPTAAVSVYVVKLDTRPFSTTVATWIDVGALARIPLPHCA